MPMPIPMAIRMRVRMRCLMLVMMMMVIMMVRFTQHERTDEIGGKPRNSNRNCLPEGNRNRPDQARNTFPADGERDQPQNDGRGKGGQIAELAGAERKPFVVAMPPRQRVGQCGDQKGDRMGAHMKAIG